MDPVNTFDKLATSHEVLFVVFYRGSWCPFCISWLKQLELLRPQIEAAAGKVVAVTSQPSSFLDATRNASGYKGDVIVDENNVLAAELKRRTLLNVAVSEKNGYSKGMAQPAVLVMAGKDKSLYQWAIVPSTMNFGGAKDRPDLTQIWQNSEAQMRGGELPAAKVRTHGMMYMLREKVMG